MYSQLKDLNILEKDEQLIIYSLTKQSWVRVDKNYIYSLERNELYKFLEMYHLKCDRKQTSKKIYSLYIFLTRKCNMSCSFCSMDAGPFVDTSNELSLEETINFLKSVSDYYIKRIVISGGEPLLSKKLFPLIDFITKEMKRTQIIIQTNGAMINEKFCEEIKDKVDRINVSIESIYDIWSDKRDDLIRRLEIVQSYNLKMEFSFVATRINRENIYDYIELCRRFDAEAGIKIVSAIGGEKRFDDLSLNETEILEFYHGIINYIIEHNYISDSNLEAILGYRPIPRQGCSAYLMNSFSVLPDGKICRCHSIKGTEFNCIGNINSINIEKLGKEMCKSEETFSADNKIFCKTCVYKHFCTGICCAEVYNCLDSTFYKPESCEWKKILIDYYLWSHNKNNNQSVWEEINKRIKEKLEDIYAKN